MTSLRRSSRTKGHDADAASIPASSNPESGAPFSLVFPAEFPIDQIQQLLPNVSLTTPSPEAVVHALELLVDFAQRFEGISAELDESRAESQRKDVEIEQALADAEKDASQVKNELDVVKREVETLRKERAELAHSRDSIQLQLSSMSSTQLSSSSELVTLRQKLEETERANRDLIGVVDRMKVFELDQQTELDTIRAQLKDIRRENTVIQVENGELKSLEATNKFKVDTLGQELQLLREENERYRLDLDQKVIEFGTFRREKHSEIVLLQSEFEAAKEAQTSSQSQLEALRQSHSTLMQSHTEALQRINDLRADLADQESKFRSELTTQKRLVTLLESRNEEARLRVQEVDSEWENMVKAADDREAELHGLLDKERQKVDALQHRVDDLRSVIEKMGSGELPVMNGFEQGDSPSAAGTPAPSGYLSASMMLSPAASLATRFQKSGKTFTEVYTDYIRIQAELAAEKQESSRLGECLAQILSDIEERAPTLQEQRLEYERIQRELERLRPQLAQALEERDIEARNARLALDRADSKTQDNLVLERQLSDVSRQLRNVMRELALRDNPNFELEDFNDSVAVEDITDTDKVITDQLVLFKNLPGLLDQNKRLLAVSRTLGTKLEDIEREAKEKVEIAESEAIKRAKVTIEGLHGKIRGQETTERSLRKEVDMLSTMLAKARQGVLQSGPESHSQSTQPLTLESDQLAEMSSILKEMGNNVTRLQDDLAASQKQSAELSVNLARSNAQIDFLNERHRVFDESASLQRKELAELQKRNSMYQGQIASLEIASHQAQDQNRELSATLERLRSETANLRAERSLLKDVEARLSTDVANLTRDNARLNSLLRDSQTIHEDASRSIEAERRRLENHIQSLESQSQDIRMQLNQELERNRHLTLQREVETRELQGKIEMMNKDIGSAREALVIAQTNEKHLTERIEELRRTLSGSHEKLAVYQRLPMSSQDISSGDDLKREVAELRASLKEAELNVEAAQSHADQFKAISETNEQALAEMQRMYDDFNASSSSEVARLQAEIASLHDRIDTLTTELLSSSESSTALRRQMEEQKIQYENEKRDLEYALADINSAESNAAVLQASIQDDLRQQVLRTQEASDKYERELIAHAESITASNELRRQLQAAQSALRDQQTEAETAKANLVSAQSSWEAQKTILDKELDDLRTRHKDLSEQNTLLHSHLESISTQATTIRQAADERASLVDTETAPLTGDASNELRAVVAYLRKEKEVVDLQLDLSRQETARLHGQVEHLRRDLDDARNQLGREREQAANAAQSAAQHNELMDKINQLNILRESNTTLRAENEANGRKVLHLEQQLRTVQAAVDPLKRELVSAQAELGARQDQIKLLEVECERWKTRNSQLLTQYKQVDPEDLRLAKEDAENQRKEVTTLRANYESLQASKDKLHSSFQQLRQQSKDIIDKNRDALSTSKAENDALVARLAEADAKVAELSASVDRLREDAAQKERQLAEASQTKVALEAKISQLARPGAATNANVTANASVELAAATASLNQLRSEHQNALAAWQKEKAELEAKLAESATLQDKHRTNARKFFMELKAAKQALQDAGLTNAVNTVPTANKPADPTIAPVVATPQNLAPESGPLVTTEPTPAPVVADKNKPNSDIMEVDNKPIPAPEPAPAPALPITVPDVKAEEPSVVIAPVAAPAAPSAATAVPEVPASPAPLAAPVAPPSTADRSALLRQKLEAARKNAPIRASPAVPTASGSTVNAPEPSTTSIATPTTEAVDETPKTPTTPTAPAGRGRGAPARGARGGRGAPAGRGRGGTPAVGASHAPAAGGLSISGAAKRPLEDGAPDSGDGSQKRIRVQRNRQPAGGDS